MDDFVIAAIETVAKNDPKRIFILHEKYQFTYGLASEVIKTGKIPSVIANSYSTEIQEIMHFLLKRVNYKHINQDIIDKSHGENLDNLAKKIDSTPGEFISTSGSTGASKKVFVSYSAQKITAQAINSVILKDQKLDELLLLPLNHSSGAGRLRAAILRGATIHYIGTPLHPKLVINTIRNFRDLSCALTPGTWRYLKKVFRSESWEIFSQLHSIEFGSSTLQEQEILEINKNIPQATSILMHFGCTEASRSFIKDLRVDYPPFYLGRPMPHVKWQLAENNNSKSHELLISGPHIASFIIYADSTHEDLTKEGSWIFTGDLFDRDENGFEIYAGRNDKICNVGGYKVNLSHVENALARIENDFEFVLTKQKHPILGDEIVLVIETKGVSRFGRIRSNLSNILNSYEIPTAIIGVNSIPKLSNGKVDYVTLNHIMQKKNTD